MDKRDKQLIINRYKERLNKFGVDIKTLASGNVKRQLIRYKILSEVGIFNGSSILDLGCGFADFYKFLKERGTSVDYTGYDISPDFIKVCTEKFPEAQFNVKDIQTDRIVGEFDFIVASQVFNNKLTYDNNDNVIKDVLEKVYKVCSSRGGVAIDMLTHYVDFKEERLHYYSPEKIFKFCKTLTNRVVLRHDYPLFEFSIYLYKDFKSWA